MKKENLNSAIFYSLIESKKLLKEAIINNTTRINEGILNRKTELLIKSMSFFVKIMFYIGIEVINTNDINNSYMSEKEHQNIILKEIRNDQDYIEYLKIKHAIDILERIIENNTYDELNQEHLNFIKKYSRVESIS